MKKKRRISLTVRVYAILIFVVAGLSAGLIFIGYRVGSRQVNEAYYRTAITALQSIKDVEPGTKILYLLEWVETEEYAGIWRKARQKGDEGILSRWMESKPDSDGRTAEAGGIEIQDRYIPFSLYADYLYLRDRLEYMNHLFHLSSACLEYEKGGVTHTLVDTEPGLFQTGQYAGEPEVFEPSGDDDGVFLAIYKSDGEWFCAARETVPGEDGTPGFLIGADVSMSDIMKDRHRLFSDSIVFVLLLSAVNIIAGLIILRRIVIRRILHLAEAVTSFASGVQTYSREAVVGEDSGRNDEIRDLYDATRSMQIRMIDYTEALTKAAAERERINTEMKMAAKIQKDSIPCVFPPFPGRKEFSLFASMEPARMVGGDFYDYFLIDENHLALVIADVSGKGIPAAMFMMSAMTLISYRTLEGGTPGEILRFVNTQLCRKNPEQMFVTVWMGILETDTGVLVHANAGHKNPVIFRKGKKPVFIEEEHDLFMGYQEDMEYRDRRIRMSEGDVLLVYTDGLTEAQAEKHVQFGEKRLLETMSRIGRRDPESIIRLIRQEVQTFMKGAEQFDDLTMLCLKYNGQGDTD